MKCYEMYCNAAHSYGDGLDILLDWLRDWCTANGVMVNEDGGRPCITEDSALEFIPRRALILLTMEMQVMFELAAPAEFGLVLIEAITEKRP